MNFEARVIHNGQVLATFPFEMDEQAVKDAKERGRDLPHLHAEKMPAVNEFVAGLTEKQKTPWIEVIVINTGEEQ